MKKYKYILICGVTMFLTACDSYLDVVPDNRTVLNSPEAIKELLVSAYANCHYYHICEGMSDNVAERPVSGSHSRAILNEEMYLWKEGTQTTQDNPTYIWSGYYSAIAAANHALEAIEESRESEKCKSQRGEALLCRAFNHFLLVNIFSEHYAPQTAATNLGIPYNTAPEKVAVQQYERNSVKEVYELLEKDITEGLPLLDDKSYLVPKYHFNKAAANAFAARFYLYMADWDKVISYSSKALGENAGNKIRDLKGSRFNGAASADYLINYMKVDEPAVLLLGAGSSWWGRDHKSSSLRYGMSVEHNNLLYTSKNVTGFSAIYYRRWLSSSVGSYYMYKYNEYFKYSYPGATTGQGYIMGALFTIEEALLNRAEAYVMKNDFTSALRDINLLLSKRVNTGSVNNDFTPYEIDLAKIKAFYDNKPDIYPDLQPFYGNQISADQMSLLKCIIDWRRKEFMQEGLRWFDIKRFHLQVEHKFLDPNQPAVVLTGDDLRRALQIPMEAQAYGIQANPR